MNFNFGKPPSILSSLGEECKSILVDYVIFNKMEVISKSLSIRQSLRVLLSKQTVS